MSKKNVTHQNDILEKPLVAGESVLPEDSKTENALDVREVAIHAHEEAVQIREEAATLREDSAGLREEGAKKREEGAERREEGAKRREEGAEQREVAADLRDKVTEHDAKAKDELSAHTEALLREANEHLVVASVRAQAITDAAEQTTSQMTHMAEHDFLTGLPNRMLLTDRLAQAISLALRHGKKVALMYLDLDHFKHINDSLGHEVGDKLLQSAAKRLQACVRFSDTVSRQGGDEFVVLLAEVEEVQGAVLIAEKLIEAMTEPHIIGDHRLHVTLSIGISLYPDDGKDVEAMIRNADTAMYHAKKSGRNNYQVFTSAMNVHAARAASHRAGIAAGYSSRRLCFALPAEGES